MPMGGGAGHDEKKSMVGSVLALFFRHSPPLSPTGHELPMVIDAASSQPAPAAARNISVSKPRPTMKMDPVCQLAPLHPTKEETSPGLAGRRCPQPHRLSSGRLTASMSMLLRLLLLLLMLRCCAGCWASRAAQPVLCRLGLAPGAGSSQLSGSRLLSSLHWTEG